MGDKGEGRVKNLKNGWRHLWTAPYVDFFLLPGNKLAISYYIPFAASAVGNYVV